VRSFGLYVQSLKPYTKLLAVVLSVALIGSTLAFGGVAAVNQTSDGDQQQTAYLKVVHASPDAPPVDVMVKNETVLSDVPFGAVSDYLALEAGTYNVTIAAAGDSETVVFDGEVTLEPRSVTTLAASGEISEGAETTFELVAYEDTAPAPADNESALRVIHLSPDAPTVDITTSGGSVVLADNVSFQNASDYVTVPEGNHTLELREATTGDNDGPVVTTVNVSLSGGTAYWRWPSATWIPTMSLPTPSSKSFWRRMPPIQPRAYSCRSTSQTPAAAEVAGFGLACLRHW